MNLTSTTFLATLCFIVAPGAIGPARAAVPDAVTAIYFFDVPPNLESRFLLGWKKAISCIRAHGAKFTALVYSKL